MIDRPIAETAALHLALIGVLCGAVILSPLLAIGWLQDRTPARPVTWREA